MKKIFALGTLVFLSSFGNSFAEDTVSNIELSCFSQVISNYNFEQADDRVYFQSQTRDVQIMQNDTPLTIVDVTQSLRYIPFTSNIGNITLEKSYNGRLYTFDSFDTNDLDTIELSVDNLIAGDFKINFTHNAKYHDAEYYMSDDGENYSRISSTNSGDFNVKKLRIVFVPNTQDEIREVIDITSLNIERTNYVLSAYNGDLDQNLDVYLYNSCNKYTLPIINISETIIPGAIIRSGDVNYLYTQRTTDSDKDGVKDLYDNCRFQSNTNQTDINQNGIGDACEFDSDNDGIADEIDVCRNISNPGQEDDDKDGIGNVCDNCNLYNPDQRDTDQNTIGDVCEQREIYILENDSDGDKVVNSLDNCEFISNPNQGDSDNDGVGNACDNCATFQNADQKDENENGIGDICEDSDGDGIDSIRDNCINISNPDQLDDDNDGIGNLCEDDDRDGVIYSLDNCPYKSNTNQLDTDKDGFGDICDEQDDRLLESNKEIFIILLMLVIAAFMGGIFFVAKKIQK